MIGADANIALRLLLNDDPVQVRQVRDLLDRAPAGREEVRIGLIALAETVWTLTHRRRGPAAGIADAVRAMSNNRPFRIFDDALVGSAVELFAAGSAAFSGCIIRAMDGAAGCSPTLTFDRPAPALPGFSHPPAEG